MPLPASSSNPAIIWDEKITWPYPRSEDVTPLGPAFPMGRYAWNVGQVIRDDCWTYTYNAINNIAAGGQGLYCATGGVPYYQVESVAVGRALHGLEMMQVMPDIGTGFALAAGAEHCSSRRVWWLKWLMQSPDVAPDERNGLLLIPVSNRNNTRWPDDPVGPNNSGGFGFNGNGAGQWQYVSYNRAGVLLQREAVALAAHNLAEWNQFEIVIISERHGIPATAEFYFNGAFLFTRNWGGVLLEPLQANEWRYVPVICGGDRGVGAGGHTNFTSVECHRGRFTRAGVEV